MMLAGVGIGWRHAHYAQVAEERPAVDFLEVHSENFFGDGGAALAVLERGREAYPVSLHGVGLGLGSAAGLDDWHLDRLASLVERIEPALVSDHACFCRAPLGGDVVHAGDLLPLPFDEEALQVLCANVQRVQDRLRRRILVENISSYLPLAGDGMAEADFLAELARRSGCGLLVDVNNLYVNARNAAMADPALDPLAACCDWIGRIDPAVVGEIHLAGHCVLDDIVIDDHGSQVSEPVWSLYAHALARFGAVPTLVEWDTALPELAVLVSEAERARGLRAGVAAGAPR